MREDNVESVYELSPAQQGMLFHSLYAPNSGVYVVQLSVRLAGRLDPELFLQAWQRVVDRHPALRTSFYWEELDKPVQTVFRHLEVALERRSWRGLTAAEQQERLRACLGEERDRGFELDQAPLMRLVLCDLGDGAFYFVWSFHHLILDGWSQALVLREVFACYQALVERRPPPLPRPQPYRQYVAWLQQQSLGAAESYWRRRLADVVPTLLAGAGAAEPSDYHHQQEARLILTADATSELEALARRHGLTLNTPIQGAWARLLAHHCGQDEVLFGTTVAGRPAELAGVEGIAGLFINTLPARVAVPPGERLLPWLERLQGEQAELRSYEHSPLDQVQRWSAVAAGQPLFDHILVVESYPVDSSLKDSLPGLEISAGQSLEQTNYPLTLLVRPGPQLELVMDYDGRRFAASEIRRWLDQWQRLLAGFAADPGRRVAEYPLLSAGERQQIVHEWNATAADYPQDRCLHELIAAQVERTPEAPAVCFEEVRLTYRELDRRAAQVAASLRRRGVGPEVVVGVLMERSLEMVVALVGILKAGGAYLPLEPSHPRERLAFMLADAGAGRAPVVLTRERWRDRVPAAAARVVCLGPRGIAGEAPGPVSPPRVGPDNLAYVIYTSGSTGQPKGSMISHRAIVNRLLWMQDAYRLTPGEGVMQKTPFSFDVSVWEFFWPLMVGARLVVAHPGGHQDAAYLAQLIVGQQVTTMHFVPSMLRMFVAEPRLADCRCLRRVIASGEALPRQLVERFLARSGAELHNLYGPTEAAVDVTSWRCARDDEDRGVPIGRPIANLRTYLLDRRGDPVAVGAAGELHLAGVGLARGYLGRPALTAERFVPDPFSGRPGGRLYRTGDQVRLRPDGLIDYLGRLDHQVKVRGFRIELGEIETVLSRHPAVREAAVVARRDETSGDQRLVAWVAADPATSDPPSIPPYDKGGPLPSQGPTVAAIQDFVRRTLPDYMVPSAVVFVDALPLLPNGKVDRKALAGRPLSGAASRARLATAFVAPRNAAEETLAAIWAEVLGRRRVGVEDNFFELGGDSILSIRVVSKAREAGLRFGPRDLFRYPTIATLAAAANSGAAAVAEESPVAGEVPLSPIQRWLLDRRLAAPHHFNQALMLELLQPLEPRLLARTLAALLVHHDALRLRFLRRGSEWRQIQTDEAPEVPFLAVDLAALPEDRQPEALAAVAAAVQGSLDLAQGPLTRMVLVDRGPERRGRLLWVVHHLAVDGVSWRVLLEDLERVYRQLEGGEAVSLPARTTSFKSWSEKLHDYARSAPPETWWATGQEGLHRLPAERPTGPNTVASQRTVTVALTPEETRALLREVPAASEVRINEVLLAALALAFGERLGAGTLAVDLEGHGREELVEGVDLSRTVGWFTSLYPVVLATSAASDPAEVLTAVRNRLRAIPHGGVGYGLARHLAAALEAPPPAEVLFNYLGQIDEVFSSSALFRPAPEPSGPAVAPANLRSHVLEINASVSEGRLRVLWSYSENLHCRETVASWAQGYLAALRTLVRHCLASDFPLAGLDPAALARLGAGDPGIEDLYPLSPLQRGILFHAVYAPESPEYFEQLSCRLTGKLVPAALRRAWQWALDRHASLRTSFAWEDLPHPVQRVHRGVTAPWIEEDWRQLAPVEQEERLEALLAADRRRPFAVTAPPLMRLMLIRTATDVHRFGWSFHHLLLDGWSVARVMEEVFHAYAALTQGRPPAAEPVRPYRDFIAWLGGRDRTATEAFWRRNLAGLTAPTALTAERPPELANQPPDYQEIRRTAPAALGQALEEAATRQRVTANTLVQGAWALLVARYTGAEEVVFGTTVAGRPAELTGVEAMVGLFINTLPARVKASPHEPLGEYLARLQGEQAELRDWQHSPLEEVQKWSAVPTGRALVDHILVFENYPVDASLRQPAAGLAISDVRVFERTNYPLTVAVQPPPEFRVRMIFDRHVCAPATAGRMLRHFENLLLGLAGEARRLWQVPMLGPAERQQLMVEWNDTARPYPREALVHELFAAQAERAPEVVAVESGGERLTYRELNARANRLAAELLGLGVGPESQVAVALVSSPELVVAVLAILKAGGAYLPLDPAYPRERVEFMLEDAAVSVVLTRQAVAEQFKELTPAGLRVLCLEGSLPSGPRTFDPPGLTADHPAYVIYTSGSTGKPKGVSISHASLMNLVSWHQRTYQVRPGDRATQIAGPAFDASVWEIWPYLTAGATLCIPAPEIRYSAADLVSWLAAERITLSFLPTPLAELVLARDWPPEPALRALLTGGERLHHRPRPGLGFELVNHYGPTENTVVATCGTTAPGGPEVPDIGRPIANVRAYLLDRGGRPVPLGAAGELCVGGSSVARGYLNRPRLTAEYFVPDPFAAAGGRLYRTGDLARYRVDGAIEFLGRIDHQVKIRGFRIELGEVEAILARHPAVREAAVLLREERPEGGAPGADGRLVAYLVPEAEIPEPDPGALRNYLARSLPSYALPAAFVKLAALPLTANGKVDRAALPAPEWEPGQDGYVAPSTPVGEQLAALWAELLGIPKVGIEDDFFALGGHSLLAIQLLNRVHKEQGVEVSVRGFFEKPTIAGLEELVIQEQIKATGEDEVARLLAQVRSLVPAPEE